MRLIDADALRDEIIYLRPSALRSGVHVDELKWLVDEAVLRVDAAPTIPQTETVGGVTSCAFCGAVVDIEYPEDAGEPTEEVGG